MHFHTVRCLLFTAVLLNVEVRAIIRSECPVACDCDIKEKKVECTHGYWNEFPNIPTGSHYMKMVDGKFGMLQSPTGCHSYTEVTALELQRNAITAIAGDAFVCMPRIKSLIIESNFIQEVPHELFLSLHNLQNVSLDSNNLTVNIIPELCMIQHLGKITLSRNEMVILTDTLECFGLLGELSYVDLSHNVISGPIQLVLKPLMNVTHLLSVASCNITSLDNDTFAGFKLQILDLSYNEIRFIPRYAFRNMAYLTKLNLHATQISETGEWFEDLPVQEIDVTRTHISEVPDITSKMRMVKYTSRKYFSVETEKKSNLERYVLYNLPEFKLETLKLQGRTNASSFVLYVDIAEFPYSFIDFRIEKLFGSNKNAIFASNDVEILCLQYCKLKQVQLKALENFKNLRKLDLRFNDIYRIWAFAFKGLTKLVYLYLSHNKLAELHGQAFSDLPNLVILDLSDNLLTEFNAGFLGLQKGSFNLAYIQLTKNRIRHVSFQNMKNLENISLDQNEISSIIFKSFQNLTSLKVLQLASNPISDLKVGALPRLENLTFLDLSFSEKSLWHDLPGCLGHKEYLKVLDLSGSFIGYLKREQQIQIWEEAYNLKTLKINDCRISELIPGMFSILRHLTVLEARSNQIPFLDPTAFENVSSLLELNLARNLITYITWESFLNLPHLRVLSLAHNPVHCTCQVLWIIQALRTKLVFMYKHNETLCATPFEVRNMKVEELDISLSDCEDQWTQILKPLSASLASMLAFVFIYVVWHYRWRIRYTFFLARSGIGRYEELHDDRVYVYDAFVCYSGKDLPWVKEKLLVNLDTEYIGQDGYKLCLHDRDWLVGIDIVDNIVKSIVESRRTILLLTENFAKSHWCHFELATIQTRLTAEGRGRERLLVVLLGEIPTELLTPRLVHILTSKTYLRWPLDLQHQRLFWRTLRKSLKKELLYDKTQV